MRTNKRVGAIVIVDQKILLIHRFRDGQEYWVLPGGGVEDNESLEEALGREVKEETCLDLIEFHQVMTGNDKKHDHFLYECILSKGNPEIGGPEKNDSSENNKYILEWVLIEEVKKLTVYPKLLIDFITLEKL